MQFEGKPDANLIKNNMVKENLEVDKKVKTGEININTAELAQKALEDERNLANLNAAEKQQTPAQLDLIRKSMPKTENSQEAELRKAHRVEFIQKSLQMVIDNLQAKVDKTGVFSWLNPKEDMKKGIEVLKDLQGKNNDQIVWEYQFASPRPGVFADKSLQKQILSMVKEEFGPEDQKIFAGTEEVRNQIGHEMTDVSAG